jgi:hypothetical protein
VLEGKFKEGDHVLVTRAPEGSLAFERAGAPAEREADVASAGAAR